MKTAISIPDPLFAEVEALAGRLGISRSELFARAAARFLRAHRQDKVTEALDRIYKKHPSALDPALGRMQAATLARTGAPDEEEW